MSQKLSILCFSKWLSLDRVMNLSQEVFWACDFWECNFARCACQNFLALSLRFLWATGWCVSGKAGWGGGGGVVVVGCWVAQAVLGTSRNGDFSHGNRSSCTVTRHYHINVSLLGLVLLQCWERSQPMAPTADFPAKPSVRYSPKHCMLIGSSRRYSWQLLTLTV